MIRLTETTKIEQGGTKRFFLKKLIIEERIRRAKWSVEKWEVELERRNSSICPGGGMLPYESEVIHHL